MATNVMEGRTAQGRGSLRGGRDAVKTCPRCGARTFADMDVCYGCLYDFTTGEGEVSLEGIRHNLPNADPAARRRRASPAAGYDAAGAAASYGEAEAVPEGARGREACRGDATTLANAEGRGDDRGGAAFSACAKGCGDGCGDMAAVVSAEGRETCRGDAGGAGVRRTGDEVAGDLGGPSYGQPADSQGLAYLEEEPWDFDAECWGLEEPLAAEWDAGDAGSGGHDCPAGERRVSGCQSHVGELPCIRLAVPDIPVLVEVEGPSVTVRQVWAKDQAKAGGR